MLNDTPMTAKKRRTDEAMVLAEKDSRQLSEALTKIETQQQSINSLEVEVAKLRMF